MLQLTDLTMHMERPNLVEITSFLESLEAANRGDKKALEGFVLGVKPASYLPGKTDLNDLKRLLTLARAHVSDAELRSVEPESKFYIIYSPSAVAKRISIEPDFAGWLGIQNDQVGDIIRKAASSPQIEGFVLGFPEEAVKTWEEYKRISAKTFSFAQLMNANFSPEGWSQQDQEKLQVLRARWARKSKGSWTLWDFFRLQNIRPFVEELYKKYSNLSEEEIGFLFSMRLEEDEYMNYMISSKVEDSQESTKRSIEKAMDGV